MSNGIRLAVVVGVLGAGLVGWAVDGYRGAAIGLGLGLLVGVLPWRHRRLWSWLGLWLGRHRRVVLRDPITVANDRSGGGVRYQDGVAVVAVQLLGRPHRPTLFTGSTSTETDNVVDVVDLLPLLDQSLGLTIESISLVCAGARRRSSGDYPRVYDTLIGTPPYAGQRETWLIARIPALANAESLQWRTSLGTAALAAAQRIAAAMRQHGIRARVATATDMVEMERRLIGSALEPGNGRWRSVRSELGWLTTYGYRPADVTADKLGQAWALHVDGVIQNITVLPGGQATATVTVRTAQPPTAPPLVMLKPLPGEQTLALAANLCAPRPAVRGVMRGVLPDALVLPVGPSGVLLGKVGAGDRLMLPLDDAADLSRVHIAAEDYLAKRIVIRLAGAGDRITVHTRDPQRWASVRMPDIVVTGASRPAAGTTVSVVDGTLSPTPRPNTVISVGEPGGLRPRTVDVSLTQTGPATLEVASVGGVQVVEVELFRAENRYVSSDTTRPGARVNGGAQLEPVD